ncbi:MAG: YcxB family protein [Chitinophagales bacterium]|nr:YcxB family protein [Bacteroidota bacterium]MCB9044324.1 YcxB family protein [Chitinophagales bacterium]
MDKIILTTKLSLKDYIKVSYHLTYRKLAIKFITGIGLFILVSIIFSYSSLTQFPWIQLIFGLYFTVVIAILVYFYAIRNYKSNRRISETINYEFDSENIQITGESFSSKLTWNKIYSVTENKDWILIWQSRQIANIVPKRDFKEGELQAFKDIVKSQSGLKNKLKK